MAGPSFTLEAPLLQGETPRSSWSSVTRLALVSLFVGLLFEMLWISFPWAGGMGELHLASQELATSLATTIPRQRWTLGLKPMWWQHDRLASLPKNERPFGGPFGFAPRSPGVKPAYAIHHITKGTDGIDHGTDPDLNFLRSEKSKELDPLSNSGLDGRLAAANSASSRLDLESLLSGSDVRGQQITSEQAFTIGKCFAHWLSQLKGAPAPIRVAVGQDPRADGDMLVSALSAGLQAMGAEPVRLGLATTPAMYASTFMGDAPFSAGIMVTASHLPPQWNGMKFFTSTGGLSKTDVRGMLSLSGGVETSEDAPVASISLDPFMSSYKQSLVSKMRQFSGGLERPMEGIHVVLNAGNGAGGMMVEVLEALGADTSGSVNLEPDGSFPAHPANPEDNGMVKATIEAVRAAGADVGVMFDADVDRSGLIDGKSLEPLNKDRLIAAVARMVLGENPGATIVTDSVTSVGLSDFIEAEGGKHMRFKRGYRNVIDKAIELGKEGIEALLAIETSGHAALKENRWMDDGAYLALRILTLFGTMRRQDGGRELSLMSLISGLREAEDSSEFRLKVTGTDEGSRGQVATAAMEIVDRLVTQLPNWSLDLPNYEGVRVRVAEQGGKTGWFLLRESLHEPLICLNVESDVEGGSREILRMLMQNGLESLGMSLDLSPIRRHLGVSLDSPKNFSMI